MPQIVLSISYGKNTGLMFSPTELINQYLHGIPLCTRDGREIPQNTIREKIRAAQAQVEQFLSVKLERQILEETRDFVRSDYFNWGFMKVTYPVRCVTDLTGFIASTRQVEFPMSWVSSKYTTDDTLLYRTIHIVPAGSDTPNTNSVVFVGITPNAGFFGVQNIPNYWRIEYCSGFDVVPANLREAVGKLASIQLLALAGDILLGAGITSQSLSMDGLSQSISTTRSSNSSIYAARIKQYSDELSKNLLEMRDWYKGINFLAC